MLYGKRTMRKIYFFLILLIFPIVNAQVSIENEIGSSNYISYKNDKLETNISLYYFNEDRYEIVNDIFATEKGDKIKFGAYLDVNKDKLLFKYNKRTNNKIKKQNNQRFYTETEECYNGFCYYDRSIIDFTDVCNSSYSECKYFIKDYEMDLIFYSLHDISIQKFFIDPIVESKHYYRMNAINYNVTQLYNYTVMNLSSNYPFNGTIMYFNFDYNTSDGQWLDISGNEYHAIEFGTVNRSDGIIDDAVKLSSNGHLSCYDVDEVDNVNQMTVCAWLYHTADNADHMILSDSQGVASGGFLFQRDNVGSSTGCTDCYTVWVNDAGGGAEQLETNSNTATANEWRHVCFTYNESDSNGLNLYINGQLAAGPADVSDLNDIDSGAESFRIGKNNGFDRYFEGYIDELMVFKHFLNITDIQDIFNNQSHRFVEEGNQTIYPIYTGAGYNRINVSVQGNVDQFGNVSYEIMFDNFNFDADKLYSYYNFEFDQIWDFGPAGNDGILLNGDYTENEGLNDSSAYNFSGGGSDGIESSREFTINDKKGYTIALWFKKNDVESERQQYLISKPNIFTLAVATTLGTHRMYYYNDAENFRSGASGVCGAEGDTDWHFVTFGINSTATKNTSYLFCDGELLDDVTLTQGFNNENGKLIIGASGAYVGEFNGTLDEIMIFNESLDSTEIGNLYNEFMENNHNYQSSGFRANGTDFNIASDVFSIITNIKFQSHSPYFISPYYSNLIFKTYNSSGEAEPPDTCTYSSGTWNIDCSDSCNLDSNTDLGGNDFLTSNAGNIAIHATISNIGALQVSAGCILDVHTDGKMEIKT